MVDRDTPRIANSPGVDLFSPVLAALEGVAIRDGVRVFGINVETQNFTKIAIESLSVTSLFVPAFRRALRVKVVGGAPVTKPEVKEAILPKNQISSIMIPLWLVHGEDDALASRVGCTVSLDFEFGEMRRVIKILSPP